MFLSQINSSHAAQHSAVAVMYHHVGEDRYPTTSVRLDQFEAQLKFLQENNFQVWPLAKTIEQLRHGKALPDKTIALTMDDGYLNVYMQRQIVAKIHPSNLSKHFHSDHLLSPA